MWVKPKTNWVSTDYFNRSDYNRIKNNLVFIYERAKKGFAFFEVENLGADVTSPSGIWTAEQFNKLEANLVQINQHTFNAKIGNAQKFYDNGAFIGWEELNRLESGIDTLNSLLERHEAAQLRIPWRLGNRKGF